jgi:hypothetical protein
MTVRPKAPADLALAPVAVAIDVNLAALRDAPAAEISYQLDLALDHPEHEGSAAERAARVLALAVRNVDLHAWRATITDDHCRLHLAGGSVSLDLGLSAAVRDYIESGA